MLKYWFDYMTVGLIKIQKKETINILKNACRWQDSLLQIVFHLLLPALSIAAVMSICLNPHISCRIKQVRKCIAKYTRKIQARLPLSSSIIPLILLASQITVSLGDTFSFPNGFKTIPSSSNLFC